MDWAVGKGLKLANTYFMKPINHLIICKLCHIENVADQISRVENVKVVTGVSQHHLLIMNIPFKKEVKFNK